MSQPTSKALRLLLVFGAALLIGVVATSLLVSRPEPEYSAASRAIPRPPKAPSTADPASSPTALPGIANSAASDLSLASPPPLSGYEGDYAEAQKVARRFVEAYASFDWRDPDPREGIRQRSRPWATAALNRFLDEGSSAAHLTHQRVQAQEVATVEIVSMDDISPKGPGLVTFIALGRAHRTVNGPTPTPVEQFYELTVVLEGDRWLVDRLVT